MILLGAAKVQAQDYEWAIGVRGATHSSGVSVKHNFDPANSLEVIAAFDRGFNVFALYQYNIPVIADGFNFYYGAGGNAGSWKKHNDRKFTVGIDGVVGLEYKIRSIPLAFSADYKPCVNLTGHTGFFGDDFGFTMKVAF